VHTIELKKMSWTEVRDLDRTKTVMLVPIGAVEQHGPAGILGSDYVLSYEFSLQSADQMEDVIVTPPICFGYSEAFRHFDGTISIRPATLTALIRDVCEALIGHGLKKIILVNSHPGNEPICEHVARDLKEEHGVTIGLILPWELARHVARDLYDDPARSFGHGAEPAISVMMHLFGKHFDESRLEAGSKGKALGELEPISTSRVSYKGHELGLYRDAEDLNPSGATADPAGASREKGEKILHRMVEYGVGAIKELAQHIG